MSGRAIYESWRVGVPDAPAWDDMSAAEQARWNAIVAEVRAILTLTPDERDRLAAIRDRLTEADQAEPWAGYRADQLADMPVAMRDKLLAGEQLTPADFFGG